MDSERKFALLSKMIAPDMLVFTTRPPDGLPLWLPESLALPLGIKPGDRLTERQLSHPEIARLLELRSRTKGR